ncbi:MAG: malate dehydrogenase, partial [Desulfovibrionaceae bacterium]|nr:malate dehydrogenase [Desulfovibrionaceae bacterium]
ALDVGATEINEAMKIAAARALAALAKEPVPESVSQAYEGKSFSFGPDYIIPKPLDPRIIEWETPAVAQAAMDTGVATRPIADMEAYRRSLVARVRAAHARAKALADSYK